MYKVSRYVNCVEVCVDVLAVILGSDFCAAGVGLLRVVGAFNLVFTRKWQWKTV